MTTMTLQEYLNIAIADLDDWISQHGLLEDPAYEIYQIVDSSTPVYTNETMRLAYENWSLFAIKMPEYQEVAPPGTPEQIVTANIYEYFVVKLHEHHHAMYMELGGES